MSIKPIDRLLFAQGGQCFFCQKELAPGDASIEHLVAKANGGGNGEDNVVACCKAMNSLMGHMSLKEKLGVILKQKGVFKCPNGVAKSKVSVALPEGAYERVLEDLRKRGENVPKTVKALKGSINNLFQKGLSPQQLDALLSRLKTSEIVTVEGTKISYKPDTGV